MRNNISIRHKNYLIFLLSVFLIIPDIVTAASVSGTIVHSQGTTQLKYGFSFQMMNSMYDEVNPVTVVILSEEPINNEELAKELYGKDSSGITDVLWNKLKRAFGKLIIPKEGDISAYFYIPPGRNFNYSFSNKEHAQIKDNSDKHTEVIYSIQDTDSDGNTLKFDLKWDLNITELKKP